MYVHFIASAVMCVFFKYRLLLFYIINSVFNLKHYNNYRYTDKYFAQVYGGFLCTYLFLQVNLNFQCFFFNLQYRYKNLFLFYFQTFAIPGSIFLSIISGFLFPFPLALFSVCFCSATGKRTCIRLVFVTWNNMYLFHRRFFLLSAFILGWKKVS